MKRIRGNALSLFKQHNYDALAHGCNCFCSMAGGFAKQLAVEFPLAERVDNETKAGCEYKLGSFSKATLPNGKKIYNLYTVEWRR